jgi:hypothetical protein
MGRAGNGGNHLFDRLLLKTGMDDVVALEAATCFAVG